MGAIESPYLQQVLAQTPWIPKSMQVLVHGLAVTGCSLITSSRISQTSLASLFLPVFLADLMVVT